jgi:hypothetical protein
MANEVPGVRVPGHVVERMAAAEARGQAAAREEGILIASEILAQARPLVAGAHVGTAGGARTAIDLLTSAGLIGSTGTRRPPED